MYQPLAGAGAKLPKEFWIKQVVHTIVMLSAFYINLYFLVPKLLLKDKLVTFLIVVILFSLVSNVLLVQIDTWLKLSKQLDRTFGRRMWPNPYFDVFGLITTLMALGISTSVAIIDTWNRDTKLRQEFESQRTIAELSFLKAQIHPHFFFNTLNSIYALTYINVETSRQVLHKLSRMMRYLLYETQQNTTMLSKEVAFIQDYIEIMKLRLNSNTTVQFTLPDKIEEMPIASMLLLPFVENAFKHGIDDLQPSTIVVDIKQLPDGLALTIKNKMVKKQCDSQKKEIEGKGIGMVNTRRRLDLLYKDKYSLNINPDVQTNEYNLHLTLNLV